MGADGAIGPNRGVPANAKATVAAGDGNQVITVPFNRDVSQCAATASPTSVDASTLAVFPAASEYRETAGFSRLLPIHRDPNAFGAGRAAHGHRAVRSPPTGAPLHLARGAHARGPSHADGPLGPFGWAPRRRPRPRSLAAGSRAAALRAIARPPSDRAGSSIGVLLALKPR